MNFTNNIICHGSRLLHYASALSIDAISRGEISYNDISDMFWCGLIIMGYRWYDETMIVKKNHIYHIGYNLMDGVSGIYLINLQTALIVQNNYIHHIGLSATEFEPFSYDDCGVYGEEWKEEALNYPIPPFPEPSTDDNLLLSLEVKYPNTKTLTCPTGYTGECDICEENYGFSGLFKTCTKCGENQVSNGGTSQCKCGNGYVSNSFGKVVVEVECITREACLAIEKAEVSGNNCVCSTGYSINSNKTQCIKNIEPETPTASSSSAASSSSSTSSSSTTRPTRPYESTAPSDLKFPMALVIIIVGVVVVIISVIVDIILVKARKRNSNTDKGGELNITL